MPLTSSFDQPAYIGTMDTTATGPVATEMLKRLDSALSPSRIALTDDSEKHRGHGGYNLNRAEIASSGSEKSFHDGAGSAPAVAKARVVRSQPA